MQYSYVYNLFKRITNKKSFSTSLTLWYPGREDVLNLFLIALLPLIIALPQLLGWLKADPALYVGGIAKGYQGGFLPGCPYIDPNNGFTTQALGYRAALDWMHGIVPWWNPYSGVGLPLAAEYQPAAFFPLTFLLLLPNGMVWEHLMLQVLAGWGTYGLLRQLGLKPIAAFTGGILFAFNGTLAWFDHASALPVPFLPWMLWGVERAFAKANLGLKGGWRVFAMALAMNLLAGFPETAYLSGLLALVWVVLRWAQSVHGYRIKFVWRIILGGVVGIALAAPQILAFFLFLPHAFLAGHSGAFANAALPHEAIIPSLIAPYVYGPIEAYSNIWNLLWGLWGGIGGYVTILVLIMAIYGFFVRRSALAWVLIAWFFLTLGKTFGFHIITAIWNALPAIKEAAFFRYITPTWELALIILVSFGIDNLANFKSDFKHLPRWVTITATFLILGSSLLYIWHLWTNISLSADLRHWAIASILWSGITVSLCLIFIFLAKKHRKVVLALVSLIVIDIVIMFAIPTLSNPRAGEVDMPAISFLQKNLDFNRFYTLGPIQPNYGAYFGIASINHNYLPINQQWVDWVQTHLDNSADPVCFTGNFSRPSDQPSQAQELRKNLTNYEWAGVKYVVAPAGDNPFIETLSTKTNDTGNKPLVLQPGQSANGIIPAKVVSKTVNIDAMGVLVGNYNNTALGRLKIKIYSAGGFAEGEADLSQSQDNGVFYIPLNAPFQLTANMPVTYTITHDGGKIPVALWAYPTNGNDEDQNLTGPVGAMPGMGLQLNLRIKTGGNLPKQVYSDELMNIYELPNFKPYFEVVGESGSVRALSRTQVIVESESPAVLIRRELYFPGWSAEVNGKAVAISDYKGLFQAINLPAGKSIVKFNYAPPYVNWAWLAMWIGLAVLVFSIFRFEWVRLKIQKFKGV
jgi:hypothetical protein